MKPSNNNSIVVDESIDGQSKKVNHTNQHDDHNVHDMVSPPSSPTGQLRGRWTHNPIVLSMLACSTLQNCEQVREVYRECVEKNDTDSMMCEAAAKYYKMCHMKNGSDSGILDFAPYHET